MPISWDQVELGDASEEEFNALPSRRAGKRIDPREEEILNDIEAGRVRTIRVPDESQLRGIRVSLGRLARQRGFGLDYRTDGPTMYVRKSDEPLRKRGQAQAEQGPRRRGRPPRSQREAEASEVPASPA